MHYSRTLKEYWRDRLLKFKAAGLNAVQTYVPWNFHETYPEMYDFSGDKDLEGFLQTAKEVGIYVIVRAGPYICAEWDMGGLPSWLLTHQNISTRTSDPVYMKYVDRWMSVLLPKVERWLYINGGSVITIQVENEYGSFPACDAQYLEGLHSIFRKYLGNDAILFTTDGPSQNMLKCGANPKLFYATVDFGGSNAETYFKAQREVEPQGPLVNSEYYVGWFDNWGSPHSIVSDDDAAKGLDVILSMNANVNMYMFEGGTNFGFWSGANHPGYDPITTSYNYDAPLTEAGDPSRDKFAKISTVIQKYCNCETHVPPTKDKASYGKIPAVHYATLSDNPQLYVRGVLGPDIVTMEEMGQVSGFISYTASFVQEPYSGNSSKNFSVIFEGIRDRALIFVNDVHYKTVERFPNTTDANDMVSVDLTISSKTVTKVMVFVENMGRGSNGGSDIKGLIGPITTDPADINPYWLTESLPLNNTNLAVFIPIIPSLASKLPTQLAFFRFVFNVTSSLDTYLDVTGWGKGVAFVNGFNIGRYWPTRGPQMTLYVPGSLLNSNDTNEIVLFEVDASPCRVLSNCYISLIDQMIIIRPQHCNDHSIKNS